MTLPPSKEPRSSEQLCVTCVQFDIQPGPLEGPDPNIARAAQLLAGASLDLTVLPELCHTGYLHESRERLFARAQTLPNSPLISQLTELASALSGHVVAGIAERDGERLYNTAVVVDRAGLVTRARKNYPTTLERTYFEPAHDQALFTLRGITCGVLTCFDLWPPELTRLLVHAGARILCCPANFGGPHSLDVARIRALENGVFLLLANRIGHESNGNLDVRFRGESRVLSPTGEILTALDDQPGAAITPIDPSQTEHAESPLFQDIRAARSHYTITPRSKPTEPEP